MKMDGREEESAKERKKGEKEKKNRKRGKQKEEGLAGSSAILCFRGE